MAYAKTERLVELLAKVDGGGSDRVVGMHVTYINRFTDGGDVQEFPGRTVVLPTFAALAALMHPDDQDALHAALTAAIAARS